MKNKIFKGLILGVCFSVLFSVGSFASSKEVNDVSIRENRILPSASLVDSLLFKEPESNDKHCNTVSVIIRLGDNFGENAGYYKLDVKTTFGLLYDTEIKESTAPEHTVLSPNYGSISVNLGDGGCHCFLLPFELFLYGITPENSYYIPEIEYIVFMDRGHNCPLYFQKLEECPEGGVKLNQPTSITEAAK